jgi:hypothetical protein
VAEAEVIDGVPAPTPETLGSGQWPDEDGLNWRPTVIAGCVPAWLGSR